MQYVTTINPASVPGITAARAAYNASLPATIDGGQKTAEGAPIMVANPALLSSDSAYLDFVLRSAVDSWNRQFAPVIAPPVLPPAAVNGVPQEVTRRQGIQALIIRKDAAGVSYKSKVQPAIDAIVDPMQRALMQAEWDESQTFQRQRPALIQMATAIGLTTPAQIDDLFVFAATL